MVIFVNFTNGGSLRSSLLSPLVFVSFPQLFFILISDENILSLTPIDGEDSLGVPSRCSVFAACILYTTWAGTSNNRSFQRNSLFNYESSKNPLLLIILKSDCTICFMLIEMHGCKTYRRGIENSFILFFSF